MIISEQWLRTWLDINLTINEHMRHKSNCQRIDLISY